MNPLTLRDEVERFATGYLNDAEVRWHDKNPHAFRKINEALGRATRLERLALATDLLILWTDPEQELHAEILFGQPFPQRAKLGIIVIYAPAGKIISVHSGTDLLCGICGEPQALKLYRDALLQEIPLLSRIDGRNTSSEVYELPRPTLRARELAMH